MSTSLAAQLKKLEAPQTALLFHKKTKASFLFEGKQAGRLDRDTVYDIGLSGLEELKKLNSNFGVYEGSLFDVASRNFERSVESSEANEKLNFQIKTFLNLLSPYFLLKPAHKALEWLINRYHIHEFNIDDLMFLILPYHETMLFARMLQLFRLEEHTGKWHWLYEVQKKGVALSKSALLNRAANDMSFLKFVCDMPEAAIKINGNKATSLTTLYAFYCTTLIGALEHARSINELHVTHILPSIMSALSSSIPDFTASGFMIIARLATKANLSEKIREALCSEISKVDHTKLRSETCLVLVLLCQNTTQEKMVLPEKVALRLCQAQWFVPSLVVLTKKQIHVLSMVLALLRVCLRLILKGEEDSDLQGFVERIINGIHLDDSDADGIFMCLLEEFNESASETTVCWYSHLFKQMETSFPKVFDTIASAALKDRESKEAAVIEQLLGFNTSRNDIYQRLVHPNPDIRVEAIGYVAKKFAPDQLGWLRQTLMNRFEDDSPEVILALFRLPRSIVDLFPKDALFSNLVSVIARFSSAKHSKLLRPSVKMLCDLIETEEQVPIVAILLLPSLFTVGSNLLDQASDTCELISELKKACKTDDIDNDLWTYFSRANREVPSPISLIDGFKSSESLQKHSKFWFSTAFLVSSSLTKEADLEKIKTVINFLIDYLKFPKIRADSKSVQTLDHSRLKHCLYKSDKLMIDGALDCLKKIIRPDEFTKSPRKPPRGWFDLNGKGASLSFFIYELIYEGRQAKSDSVQSAFLQTETEFLKAHFKDSEERLNFVLSVALHDQTYEFHAVATALQMLKEDSALISAALKENSIVVPSLMVLLTSQSQSVRSLAMDVSLTLAVSEGFYRPFVDVLLTMSEQVKIDPEQITLVAFTKLSQKMKGLMLASERKLMAATLSSICEHLTSSDTPLNVKAKLLNVLELVQSEELFHQLQPIALNLIGQSKTLSKSEFSVLNSVLQRFNSSFVNSLKNEATWTFLDKVLADQKTTLLGIEDAKKPCPASLLVQQITKELFENIPEPKLKNQEKLLSLLIKHLTDSESVATTSAAVNTFKKISIDCKILVTLLTPMLTVEASLPPEIMRLRPQTRTKVNFPPSLEILQSPEWKQGTYLLEMIQNKKKLTSVEALLPCLFNILKKCLKFEHQAPVEYTKQLLLTSILCSCEKLSGDKSALSEATLEADLVVDCIRGSQNPQTHHHALLTLTHLAHLIPDKVLHNIMAIFTFIGSSVLRQDDAYSFQIICKIVDSIIPVLIKTKTKAELEIAVAGVLRVFVAALVDVPEHRRLPLFKKILAILDESQFLWLFLCLVFESHVLCSSTADVEVTTDYPEISLAPKRLDICLQVCDEYPPEVILKTCCNFLKHLNSLPLEKDEKSDELKNKLILAIFNIKRNTAKQFRHYKYTLLTFLSSLLSSSQFVQKMSEMSENDSSQLTDIFSSLVQESLLFIRIVLKQVEDSSGQNTAKYWRVILNQSYDILDKANALLPTELFLAVIKNLLENDLEAIRRKSMELLGWRLLQPRPVPVEALLELLPPLTLVLNSLVEENASEGMKEDSTSQDAQLTQQTALFALKLMTRHLAPSKIEQFKRVLIKVTDVIGWEKPVNWPVLGSLILCLGELVSSLKAQALFQLSKFMPSLLKLFNNFKMDEGGDLFLQSMVTALLKIVDCLVHFLSPYMPKILFEVCLLSSKYPSESDKSQPLAQKLKAIRIKLSTDLPNRVLVPSARTCFINLIKNGHYDATGPLMTILADNFKSGSDLTVELTEFFLEACQFRQAHTTLPLSTVAVVEDSVVSCFSSLVLKLSESGFRPLYYKLYDWALRSVEHRERTITFFRLSVKIAESLKNLFNLFAGIFVTEAAELLDGNNTMKNGDFFEDETEKSCLLVESILRTFYTVFTYDAHNFLTKERFNHLMQPLVDQLENQVGGEEIWKRRNEELVIPCLGQMARSIVDDSLWKQLNYNILLKSRSENKFIRLSSARTVCALASKLGEDFLPLLPESVPFLAELLEDEEEDVEKECRRIVHEMEQVLGEPIQKYF